MFSTFDALVITSFAAVEQRGRLCKDLIGAYDAVLVRTLTLEFLQMRERVIPCLLSVLSGLVCPLSFFQQLRVLWLQLVELRTQLSDLCLQLCTFGGNFGRCSYVQHTPAL